MSASIVGMSDELRRPHRIGIALGVIGLAFAYRDLLTLGPRYGVQSGVEYWLFVPNDRAPVAVVALAAWLAWRRWPRLARLPERAAPAWQVALALATGAGIYGWAARVGAEDLQALSLMATLAGLLLARWGLPGLRTMALPVLFLVFCIPIPSPLLVTLLWELRLATTEYTGWLLHLLGIPAFVSGDQIVRPSQTFQVVEGCSGLRSAETLTMLVVLFVDLFRRRGRHRLILVLAAPLIAYALNGLRVLTLVLNPHSGVAEVHSLQGIAILLVGLLVVYALDGVLARLLRAEPPREPPGGPPPREDPTPATRWAGTLVAVALAICAMGLGVPAWDEPRRSQVLEEAVDEALAGLPWDDAPSDPYFVGRTYFRESVRRSYTLDSTAVEVFVGSIDMRDRRTSIVSRVTAYPGSGWQLRDRRTTELPDGTEVEALVVEKGAQRRLVYHWLIGVAGLGAETLRSFLGFERSELRRPHAQLAVRLSTAFTSFDGEVGFEGAEGRLDRIYERLRPALRTASWPPAHESEAAETATPDPVATP